MADVAANAADPPPRHARRGSVAEDALKVVFKSLVSVAGRHDRGMSGLFDEMSSDTGGLSHSELKGGFGEPGLRCNTHDGTD